jgi:3-methylfumaryl-CoA hydratase
MSERDLSAMNDWIGRSHSVEDEITRPALRRITALLDRDDSFAIGQRLPPHWYAMFFPDLAPNASIGPDGHPRTGDFLPPVPLPRRMLAGRRIRVASSLRVGDLATKRSTITAITQKRGRSGALVFVTIRHDIETSGRVVLTEEQDVVYRDAPSENDVETSPEPAAASSRASAQRAPEHVAWTVPFLPTPVTLFRYSAITFNSHRIHYDAPYARETEGYPALVVNGGLTTLFLLEAATARMDRALVGYDVRTVRPLFVDRPATLAGGTIAHGAGEVWATDEAGKTALSARLRCA